MQVRATCTCTAFSLTFRMFITDADTEWLFLFSPHITVIQVCPVIQVVCYGLKYFFNSVTFLCRNLEVMLYFMIMGEFIRRVGTQASMSCVCDTCFQAALGADLPASSIHKFQVVDWFVFWVLIHKHAQWRVHECSSCVWWFSSVQLQRCPK